MVAPLLDLGAAVAEPPAEAPATPLLLTIGRDKTGPVGPGPNPAAAKVELKGPLFPEAGVKPVLGVCVVIGEAMTNRGASLPPAVELEFTVSKASLSR